LSWLDKEEDDECKKSFLFNALTTKELELLVLESTDELINIVKANVIARIFFLRLIGIYLEQYLL
jgi:hypothetical protein